MEGDGVEEEKISFVAEFKYLGFLFKCDGDRWAHVEQRMNKATTVFGSLGHIWRDASLSKGIMLLGIYCTSHYIYTKIQAKFLSNRDERAPLVASEAIRVPLGHFASY